MRELKLGKALTPQRRPTLEAMPPLGATAPFETMTEAWLMPMTRRW